MSFAQLIYGTNVVCKICLTLSKQMASNTKTILKLIPSVASLTNIETFQCTVQECSSTFRNLSNLNLHLEKHHRINVLKATAPDTIVQYFCPIAKCKYNATDHPKAVYFKSKKYLRQHFLKVHADKKWICEKCQKSFPSESFLIAHQRNCGEKFTCEDCQWSYTSRESLLTHCRRKNHTVPMIATPVKKVLPKRKSNMTVGKNHPISPKTIESSTFTESSAARIRANFDKLMLKLKRQSRRVSQHTQTPTHCEPKKTNKSVDASVQLKNVAVGSNDDDLRRLGLIDDECQQQHNLNHLNFVEDDNSLNYFTVANFNVGLCHNETQTELLTFSESQNDASREMDPLLCHMHTQTCDDIMTEFGLNNIETQTNWTENDYNDLFVSTETQTCLQHLIGNISTQTQTSTPIETNSMANSTIE